MIQMRRFDETGRASVWGVIEPVFRAGDTYLFSPRPPLYTIGWLAVAGQHRRRGIGQRLLGHVIGLVEIPCELVVTTFGADNPAGEPARRFYERMGFHAHHWLNGGVCHKRNAARR